MYIREVNILLEIRLRAARKAKKLTQEQLASSLNTTKATISNWENGHSTPSNDMLILISKTLDCSTDYLLGIIDTPFLSKNDNDLKSFSNDPSLQKWYKELSEFKEEDLRRLRRIWNILNDNEKI